MGDVALVKKPFMKPVKLQDLNGFSTLRALSGIGSLNINVRRYYSDANGTKLDKTSLLIPNGLKVSLPVFLLGNFDRIGAYNIGQKVLSSKIPSTAVYFMTYVHGYDQPFLWFTGFMDIASSFKKGDIVTVYTDNITTPTAFAYIVQTCDYGSLASIIANTMTQQEDGTIGMMKVQKIKYQVDQDAQLNEVWQVITINNLGQFKQNPYSPIIKKDPYLKTASEFLEIDDLQFVMTQYTAIDFMMQFTTDTIQVNFTIQTP